VTSNSALANATKILEHCHGHVAITHNFRIRKKSHKAWQFTRSLDRHRRYVYTIALSDYSTSVHIYPTLCYFDDRICIIANEDVLQNAQLRFRPRDIPLLGNDIGIMAGEQKPASQNISERTHAKSAAANMNRIFDRAYSAMLAVTVDNEKIVTALSADSAAVRFAQSYEGRMRSWVGTLIYLNRQREVPFALSKMSALAAQAGNPVAKLVVERYAEFMRERSSSSRTSG